jgi:hypothetical protein
MPCPQLTTNQLRLRPVLCRRQPYQFPVFLQLSSSDEQKGRHRSWRASPLLQKATQSAYIPLQLFDSAPAKSQTPTLAPINTAAKGNLCISHLFAGIISLNFRADDTIYDRRRQVKIVDSPKGFSRQSANDLRLSCGGKQNRKTRGSTCSARATDSVESVPHTERSCA